MLHNSINYRSSKEDDCDVCDDESDGYDESESSYESNFEKIKLKFNIGFNK